MDTHSIPMYYHGMDRPILSAGVSLSLSLKRPRSQEPAIISFWNVTPKMLIQYIYIYCEQNDPCSGCYPKSFPEHLAFAFSSVSMAATEERLVFLEMGT